MISILVVVPTLNSCHLLPRLVRSLEEQSFTRWRVLFVDGKSDQCHKNWLRDQCAKDARFQWEEESPNVKGIFSAMNQGFRHAREDEWILFWGSDDIAADKDVFQKVENGLKSIGSRADLYICSARYYSMGDLLRDGYTIKKDRISRFEPSRTFRESLFWGSTPPHQATLVGPGARRLLNSYNEEFRITADLDYFLRLSQLGQIQVFVDTLVLVLMGNAGVSARECKRRTIEVIRSYRKSFGYLWIFPFVLRYTRRAWSILKQL